MATFLSVFKKDIRSEIRTRYSISAILLFILTSCSIIGFGIAGSRLDSNISSALLWVIMFFTSMIGLSKSFVTEEERGTFMLLKLYSSSSAVYFGKLLFNIVLCVIINFFASILFLFFINQIEILSISIFWLSVILGSIAIGSASTIISAIISKSNVKNAIFPVLSFPVMLPIIIAGLDATRLSYSTNDFSEAVALFIQILAFTIAIVSISYVLFSFVWNE